MRLTNLTTELDFVRAVKASCQYYWSTTMSKRLAVDAILLELGPKRKTDRQIDRWWHQYQNMAATMRDTVAAVRAAIEFVHAMEKNHGIETDWEWNSPVGSHCLVLDAPLCPKCEGAAILDVDWMDAATEHERFWRILDAYTNDFRAGTAWITSQQNQLNNLPESAVRDDLELAYSKLQWRLVQACSCSAMVSSREFNGRGINAVADDGRIGFLPTTPVPAAEAVLERARLCRDCAGKVRDTSLKTEEVLARVVDRRRGKRPVSL